MSVKVGTRSLPLVCKGESLVASSQEAKDQFLQIIGLTAADIPIEGDNTLTDDEATLIALALNHTCCSIGIKSHLLH